MLGLSEEAVTSIYSDISRRSMMSFFTLFDAVAVQSKGCMAVPMHKLL